MPHLPSAPALLLLAAIVVSPLRAQSASGPAAPISPPPDPLTADVRAAVADTVAAQLERFYAVGDTGKMMAEHLRQRLRSGAYDAITSPQLFAEALSTDMKAINGDKHLSVGLRQPGAPVVPPGTTTLPMLGMQSPPPAPPAQLAASRRNNFGIAKVEVLPGNVGYVDFRGFNPYLEAEEAVATALRLLEHTEAMIIDVRDHPGGSGVLSNFIISHFTGPDTVHVLDVEVRAANQRSQRWTRATVPGPRRPDVPLYLLTSRGTVSAGEDFAFVMKNIRRATLVGETTIGAGRNNPSFDAGHGFAASISVSRVMDPKTGAEWEMVGVTPHIAVPPRRALAVAHAHALDVLARSADTPARRRELELTREYAEARARTTSQTEAALRRFAGVYGGERTITVEQGQLVFRRLPDRLGMELVQLSDTLFALGPVMRLSFEPDGNSYRLRFTPPAGPPLVFARTGDPPSIHSEY